MKTILGVVVGALCGAAITVAYFKANPPGSSEKAALEKQLTDTRFDLDASKKVENRLRERVATLTEENQRASDALASQSHRNSPSGRHQIGTISPPMLETTSPVSWRSSERRSPTSPSRR